MDFYPGRDFPEFRVWFSIFLPPIYTTFGIIYGETFGTHVIRWDVNPALFYSFPSVEGQPMEILLFKEKQTITHYFSGHFSNILNKNELFINPPKVDKVFS